ncbi:MAG: HAMP domain-containing protein [Polyangiaceae bacterium]|nr:HAMP domain-containing protein [Polyangiaceae bacterium]MCB9610118.1 HAMP domain-containing protein [Polyangiaceae bacterium]
MAVGRIQRRLALAIVLTALIPLVTAIAMGEWMVRQTSARFYTPEVGTRLDDALDVYQDLARAVKARMRGGAANMAEDTRLRRAVFRKDKAAVDRALKRLFPKQPDLVTLSVEDADGESLGEITRGKAFDPATEFDLEVRVPLVDPDAPVENPPELVAVFATEAKRFQERDQLSTFLDAYRTVERRREGDDSGRLYAFSALLGITILMAIGVGTTLARSVSARIGELAEATQKVGEGDLDIRVPEKGQDEITDLAAAFNRMVMEVETSRARIEYLQRIGAWQEMARRLAHEIKNPLTPIQLAVQEIHRRYPGADANYKRMLDTTLEIVEDEVGTLRRLVSEFSNFARLPRAELKEADLGDVLRELQGRSSVVEEEDEVIPSGAAFGLPEDSSVDLEIKLPEDELPVLLDRDMFKRVLVNLVRNAAQASAEQASGARPRVKVSIERQGEQVVLDVDDNGPGIPEDQRKVVFDPYVTTKSDGTGLGLAIVKKIVVEHGGLVTALESPLGGARLRVRLPVLGSAASEAALAARSEDGPISTRA